MLWVFAACSLGNGDAPDNEHIVGSGDDTMTDVDGDGYDARVDCDDLQSAVHPGAAETCGNGRDDNCNGTADGCDWSGQLVLEGTKLTGAVASAMGSALAVCDANGDGIDDVVVGASAYGSNAGAVFVFYGPIDGDRDANDPDYEVWGTGPELLTGAALDCRRDIDGDGVADIIVSAPTGTGVSAGPGTVYVVPGGGTGRPPIDDAASTSWTGSESDERLGFQVVAIDVDGDDTDELAVTTALTNAGPNRYGIAYLFDDTGPGERDADAAVAYVYGEQGDRIEATVGNAGDLDGDGLEELAITGINQVAEELLVFDAPLVGPVAKADADVRILGGGPNDVYWSGIDHADLDGDGRDDLFAGNPAHDGFHGAVYAFFAPVQGDTEAASADIRILGADDAHPSVGSDVTCPGDVDGDGRADLLIAAVTAGTVYLQYGGERGQYLLEDTAQASWQAASAASLAGTTVAAGDVDDDGIVEFLFGAPGDEVGQGSVTIVPSFEI